VIREHLFHSKPGADRHFRWRGGTVSRIEGLSDAVFALTLTLIVMASSVPDTFHEFWLIVRDLPAFAACFVLLMVVWVEHHRYFRRYGLEDTATLALNSLLLFLVVFYAFPLKFMMTFLWHLTLGENPALVFELPEPHSWPFAARAQPGFMMIFYGLGGMAVFATFTVMHLRAYLRRRLLELDELEEFLVRSSIRENVFMAFVPGLSATLAWYGTPPGFCGLTYILLWPLMMGNGIYEGVTAKKVQKAMAERAT
jgi:uncharacterized membrane protein